MSKYVEGKDKQEEINSIGNKIQNRRTNHFRNRNQNFLQRGAEIEWRHVQRVNKQAATGFRIENIGETKMMQGGGMETLLKNPFLQNEHRRVRRMLGGMLHVFQVWNDQEKILYHRDGR